MSAERSAYYPHMRQLTECVGESLTHQSFAEQCDINNIMAKYERTGLIEHQNRYKGRYEDVSTARDLHAALQIVHSAMEMFDSLPAKIRKRFENDPATFLEFVQDAENQEEINALGLGPDVARPDKGSEATPDTVPATEGSEGRQAAQDAPEGGQGA